MPIHSFPQFQNITTPITVQACDYKEHMTKPQLTVLTMAYINRMNTGKGQAPRAGSCGDEAIWNSSANQTSE